MTTALATNVCLDAIARDERRSTSRREVCEERRSSVDRRGLWLQPIPDSLIEPISQHDADPETIVLSRETIEIAKPQAFNFSRRSSGRRSSCVTSWAGRPKRPRATRTGVMVIEAERSSV